MRNIALNSNDVEFETAKNLIYEGISESEVMPQTSTDALSCHEDMEEAKPVLIKVQNEVIEEVSVEETFSQLNESS